MMFRQFEDRRKALAEWDKEVEAKIGPVGSFFYYRGVHMMLRYTRTETADGLHLCALIAEYVDKVGAIHEIDIPCERLDECKKVGEFFCDGSEHQHVK